MSPAETSADNTGADDTSAEQASQADTSKTGTAKAGTAAADSAKADSAKADTAKADTAKADSAKAGTAKAGTAKADTAKADSAKAQSAEADPPGAGPAKAGAAKGGAAKTGAAKAGAAKAGAAKADAGQAPAVKADSEAGAGQPDSASGTGGEVADLPAEIFDAKVNVPLIHQVVVAQEAAARQGTHATKSRGAVRGGGRKPYRQKGTGRARQGSIRAPQFAGGGVVHGPQPRSYEQRTPKKMKAAALRGALSDRARHGRVHVITDFVDGDVPRTKDALAALAAVTGVSPGVSPVLVVADTSDKVTWKSLRNARGVHLLDSGQLNTYDVLVSDHVVFTRDALDKFIARATPGAGREG
jgi:large subunit ribosomal protein L4